MANYVYLSPSLSAKENLGLDEYFLDRVGENDRVFYLYINQNAVIIGKNQNPWKECDLAAMEKDGVELVRRVSGGGAVYHDAGNLNFSFIAGKGCYDKDAQFAVILSALKKKGVPAEFSGRNDLLASGKKFSGNAFAVRRGAYQHHGTLLVSSDLDRLSRYLTVDEKKIRSKGISSVRSRVCNLKELVPSLSVPELILSLKDACREAFGDFTEIEFSEEDQKEIARYREKHASKEWLFGATPKFDYEIDERFSFGGVQILLSLENGKVKNVKTYSDANDALLPEKIEEALTGLDFSYDLLAEALASRRDPALGEIAAFLFSQR